MFKRSAADTPGRNTRAKVDRAAPSPGGSSIRSDASGLLYGGCKLGAKSSEFYTHTGCKVKSFPKDISSILPDELVRLVYKYPVGGPGFPSGGEFFPLLSLHPEALKVEKRRAESSLKMSNAMISETEQNLTTVRENLNAAAKHAETLNAQYIAIAAEYQAAAGVVTTLQAQKAGLEETRSRDLSFVEELNVKVASGLDPLNPFRVCPFAHIPLCAVRESLGLQDWPDVVAIPSRNGTVRVMQLAKNYSLESNREFRDQWNTGGTLGHLDNFRILTSDTPLCCTGKVDPLEQKVRCALSLGIKVPQAEIDRVFRVKLDQIESDDENAPPPQCRKSTSRMKPAVTIWTVAMAPPLFQIRTFPLGLWNNSRQSSVADRLRVTTN